MPSSAHFSSLTAFFGKVALKKIVRVCFHRFLLKISGSLAFSFFIVSAATVCAAAVVAVAADANVAAAVVVAAAVAVVEKELLVFNHKPQMLSPNF